MTRSLRLLLPWGFRELGLDVVHWQAVAGNWASRRAAWAVGFRVEGLVRGLLADRGSRQDGWIGSLRRGDPLAPAHPWYTPPVLQAIPRAPAPAPVGRRRSPGRGRHRPADPALAAGAAGDLHPRRCHGTPGGRS